MDTEQTAELIARRAAGEPLREIAEHIGSSTTAVHRAANKPDVKEKIDKAQRELLGDTMDKAISNIKSVVASYPKYEESENKPFAALSLKYSSKVLESAGLLPSASLSLHVQNIYNSNQITITPIVQRLLESHRQTLLTPPPDIIDVDYEGE